MLGNFMASLYSEVEKTVLERPLSYRANKKAQKKWNASATFGKRQLSVWDTWCNGYSASP